jgi:hypothetical protein
MDPEFLNHQNKRLSKLEEAVVAAGRSAQEKAEEGQADKVRKYLVELNSKMFEKAQAYLNVVILAGYAGGFATWSATRANLPPNANVAIALALASSLLVFVLWEVFGMILRSRSFNRMRPLLTKAKSAKEFLAAVTSIEEQQAKDAIALTWAWGIVLSICVSLALCAFGLLFYNYLAFLLNWRFWPT